MATSRMDTVYRDGSGWVVAGCNDRDELTIMKVDDGWIEMQSDGGLLRIGCGRGCWIVDNSEW